MAINKDNYKEIFNKYVKNNSLIIDLAYRIQTSAII